MSKCQPINVTPLYDKVVALQRASVVLKSLVEKDWQWFWKWPLLVEIAVSH
jgi:hypothetical protein